MTRRAVWHESGVYDDGNSTLSIGAGGGSASSITFTPAGTISATDVQAALEEVAAEAGTGGGRWEVVVTGTDSTTSLDVEVPSGTVNSINVTFTLSATPDPSANLLLWKNGLLMKQGLDYTLSTATVTFDAGQVPQTGDILLAAVPTTADGGPVPVTNEDGDDWLYAFTT